MTKDLASFSEDELSRRLAIEIKAALLPAPVAPSAHPRAILLGGQSGSGKTMLHQIYRQEFVHNVIVINGDEYRAAHPRFRELQSSFGDASVNYTASWAGRMTEALVEHLSRLRYNLIIEGTLRTAEIPMRSAKLLRERGYEVSLALMAVKPEISLISCQLRYEEMRLAGTMPRATDPAHHNKTVDQLANNLRILERSGLFEEIYLYTRKQECIFPREGLTGTASETLEQVLFGPWNPDERSHYEYLKAKRKHLQERKSNGGYKHNDP
ncbi:zeta toxin family protein [Adlercreutzia sp. ZJ141]|uniref:zeta toxin family protein n=1 Tax=Adlercreutzia sp. ZJ141 TaxID=2709406 RepID=UPI0013EDEEE7|nr:zeta toxin family protein [Adlercreutzia sp. ZJ141]